MYQVEIYGRIRRAVLVEGRSQRSVAREFGVARTTVRKMLGYSIPPGYRRKEPPKRPKLGPWVGVIDAILEEDKSKPAKQRHTAKRIFDRLRAEHAFAGGYTIVKDYVHAAMLRRREMFIPLVHAPGTAQADFGEALVMVDGVECKAHYFAMDLPQSDDCFVAAFPGETTEAFLEAHVRAFAYFGGVPTSILYDNTKLAVAKILGSGERQKTRAFCELQSHYLFAEKFGRPAKGNDKGKVEGLVGYARRNFLVPIPRVASWEELNQRLLVACRERRARRLHGHTETIGERYERDRAALLPLPVSEYEACEKRVARVSSLSLVRYRTSDYSVPTEYGHRDVLVKGYVHEVVIVCGSQVIARHRQQLPARRHGLRSAALSRLAGAEGTGAGSSGAAGGLGVARVLRPPATAAGSATEQGRQAGVRAGAALAGDILCPGGRAGHPRCSASGHDQLRCRQASVAVPHRAATAAAGSGELSASAAGRSTDHAGRRLHDSAFGRSPPRSLPSEVTR